MLNMALRSFEWRFVKKTLRKYEWSEGKILPSDGHSHPVRSPTRASLHLRSLRPWPKSSRNSWYWIPHYVLDLMSPSVTKTGGGSIDASIPLLSHTVALALATLVGGLWVCYVFRTRQKNASQELEPLATDAPDRNPGWKRRHPWLSADGWAHTPGHRGGARGGIGQAKRKTDFFFSARCRILRPLDRGPSKSVFLESAFSTGDRVLGWLWTDRDCSDGVEDLVRRRLVCD